MIIAVTIMINVIPLRAAIRHPLLLLFGVSPSSNDDCRKEREGIVSSEFSLFTFLLKFTLCLQ